MTSVTLEEAITSVFLQEAVKSITLEKVGPSVTLERPVVTEMYLEKPAVTVDDSRKVAVPDKYS